MYKEHSVVYSTKQLENVPVHTMGTVVHVYKDGFYEVEFVTNDGSDFIKVITVAESDIEQIN